MAFSNPVTTLDGVAITGTSTITGALIRSAATGQRVQISSDNLSAITFWDEVSTDYPGAVTSYGPANGGRAIVVSPPQSATSTKQPQMILKYTDAIETASLAMLLADEVQATGNLSVAGLLKVSGTRVTPLGWFSVKDFGAVGDGVADDTAAIQATINACQAAGGGTVYFPPGTYVVNPAGGTALRVTKAGIRLVGAGRQATTLRKSGTGVLLSMSGPSTDISGATHVRYCTLQDMTLNGNGQTGLLLELFYTDNCVFRDLYFTSNADVCVDSAEFWDSHFINCVWESSGGAADAIMPNVRLRNSAAAAGYGFSTDNVNMVRFYACRWENFYNGALRIEQGVSSTNNPNGIYVLDCKMESSSMRGGNHLFTSAAARGVYVDGLYCFAGNFYSGYSTAQNVITWSPQVGALENVLIANGSVATINAGIDLFSGANNTAVLRNVIGQYSTAPTGNHIYYEASSSGDFNIQNCYGSSGSQYGGTPPTRYVGMSPLAQVAGPVSDASFTRGPANGTLALDSTNGKLYARIGGVWKSVALA